MIVPTAVRKALQDKDAGRRFLIAMIAGAIVTGAAIATMAAFWLLLGATAWTARWALQQLAALFGA